MMDLRPEANCIEAFFCCGQMFFMANYFDLLLPFKDRPANLHRLYHKTDSRYLSIKQTDSLFLT